MIQMLWRTVHAAVPMFIQDTSASLMKAAKPGNYKPEFPLYLFMKSDFL